jgi:hypothetical protein
MWDSVSLNFWNANRVNSRWILSAAVKHTDVQSRSHKAVTNWWIFIRLYKLLSLPHVHFTWCLAVTNSSLITRNADLIGSEVWGSSYYYVAPSTGTRTRHVNSTVKPTRWNMDSYYNPLSDSITLWSKTLLKTWRTLGWSKYLSHILRLRLILTLLFGALITLCQLVYDIACVARFATDP